VDRGRLRAALRKLRAHHALEIHARLYRTEVVCGGHQVLREHGDPLDVPRPLRGRGRAWRRRRRQERLGERGVCDEKRAKHGLERWATICRNMRDSHAKGWARTGSAILGIELMTAQLGEGGDGLRYLDTPRSQRRNIWPLEFSLTGQRSPNTSK
jgi:hypothetical protein